MFPMQERAYQKRGEQYLLIKSPDSGKSRALMFIPLDKLENQNLKQAIIAQAYRPPRIDLLEFRGHLRRVIGTLSCFGDS